MRLGGAVGLAAGAYVVFLLLTAPAAKILPLVKPQLPAVSFAGVSGSLWSGKAMQVSTPTLALTEVTWDFRELALFKAAIEVDVNGQLGGQLINLRAGRSVFGDRYLRDVQGRVSAAEVMRWLKLNDFAVEGYFEFAVDSVAWSGAGVPAISGTVDWIPAMLTRPIELNLGSARLNTVADDGVTSGQLSASGGVLSAEGDVTLQADGSYALVAMIKKQAPVPEAVDSFLSTFTEFKDDSYRLEWSDQLQF